MSELLYQNFERELVFVRQLSQEFARQHPTAAGRLLLENNRSADPHVERLIEAFALLTARVQCKLDDDFPELTDALLGVLFPHFLAPAPSMAMVQFELDPATAQPAGLHIARHNRLHTQKVDGLACQFRTAYPVSLWPISVASATLQSPPFAPDLQPPPGAKAALRLRLNCLGGASFSDVPLDSLRFYLDGDAPLVARLYELLFNRALHVEYRPLETNSRASTLVLKPGECLRQVGFESDEGLLPYPRRSFVGYRLLTELFAYPSKFLFVDLLGWDRVRRANFGRSMEVVIYFDRPVTGMEQVVTARTFRLGCTPIVNLFEKTAEPITLDRARFEYRVTPDVHHPRGLEVYSVDSVLSADPRSTRQYAPFYSFRPRYAGDGGDDGACWYASRRGTTSDTDHGTEVYLHLVDPAFNPRLPDESVLVVRTTCTNRDLPVRLQQAGQLLSLELENAVPVKAIRCLQSPTAPLRPPLRRAGHWRLVSHLVLNHLSLADGDEGCESLKELLRLYDYSDAPDGQQIAAVNRQMIDGIKSLRSRRVTGRIEDAAGGGICRGMEVTLELDDDKYGNVGAFLFASVLERFLACYASLNSFVQLVAVTSQSDGYLKKWPPRAGDTPLL